MASSHAGDSSDGRLPFVETPRRGGGHVGIEERQLVGDFLRHGVAIVIESGDLAYTLCDLLESFGYRAISAPTHALAAERALAYNSIELLATCVPAPDESRAGIYLEEAANVNPHLAVVLMLSDPLERSPGAPARAVKIRKPFGRKALVEAIQLAEARAAEN